MTGDIQIIKGLALDNAVIVTGRKTNPNLIRQFVQHDVLVRTLRRVSRFVVVMKTSAAALRTRPAPIGFR